MHGMEDTCMGTSSFSLLFLMCLALFSWKPRGCHFLGIVGREDWCNHQLDL